jgi:hypothetical protein
MRLLIIALVVVGVVFVAMMIFGPGDGPSSGDNRVALGDINDNGPPPILSAIGAITGRFAPKADVGIPTGGECGGDELFAKPGSGYRIVAARLVAGQGAAVVYTRRGPREAEEEVPTILCLAAEGAAPAIQVDCGNDRIEAEGNLAVGAEGGCLAIRPLSLSVVAGTVKFNCRSDGDGPPDCPQQ